MAKKRSDKKKKPGKKVSEPVIELHEPIWAVVAFDGVIATGLTYEEAVAVRTKESGRERSGVCLVTKAVADRLSIDG